MGENLLWFATQFKKVRQRKCLLLAHPETIGNYQYTLVNAYVYRERDIYIEDHSVDVYR